MLARGKSGRAGEAYNNNGHQQAAGLFEAAAQPSVTNVTRFRATEIPLKHGATTVLRRSGGPEQDSCDWTSDVEHGHGHRRVASRSRSRAVSMTVFREHAIDMDVLADLKDGELAQIGVPLGDRKRLLKAIASRCKIELSSSSRESAPPAEANLPETPTPVPLAAGKDAERRPLTVMFCDLVDSTALASRLDAEDWRSLVNAYLDEASAAVTGLGGHVLKKLGDGLMALFGYPQAQENDTERAVRAALAIHRSLDELNSRNAASAIPELVARIGLETGPVVVDATGEVFGEAPNIAARVQAAAARNRAGHFDRPASGRRAVHR